MIKLQSNVKQVLRDFDRLNEKSRFLLSQQILADSNKYARMDTGTMIMSSLTDSDLQKGVLLWNTAYAKRVYFGGGRVSKDRNRNASLLWVQVARSKHWRDWVAVFRSCYAKYS